MGDVASRELCAELYRLSGWRDDLEMWFEFGTHLGEEKKWGIGRTGEFPAYDLGYLIRKLPATMDEGTQIGYLRLEKSNHGYALCYMHGDLIPTYHTPADTPEDAACKLAIELIRQKVITPHES